MYCKNCGTQYNQGETICKQCGLTLENSYQQIQQSPQMMQPQQPMNNFNNQTTPNQFYQATSNLQNHNGIYKLTLTRPKNFVGSMVKFKIYIDNNEVGVIKNGETVVLDVNSGNHTISFNKTMMQNIQINGDTFADVGVIGSNQFGLMSIKDSTGTNTQNSTLGASNAEKIIKSAKGPLIFSCAFIGISIILLFAVQMVIAPVMYGISIGYSFINLNSIKQNKELLGDKYQSTLRINIISFVVAGIGLLISLILTV